MRKVVYLVFAFILVSACIVENGSHNEIVVELEKLEFTKGVGMFDAKPFTGQVITNYSNGFRKMQTDFVNGLDNGFFQEWDSLGNLLEKSGVKNGKLNGLRQRFTSDKVKVFEGKYSEGLLNGVVKEWDGKGDVFLIRNFVDGIEQGEYLLYDDGKLRLKGEMIDGKREGTWLEYKLDKLLYKHIYSGGEILSSEKQPTKSNQ